MISLYRIENNRGAIYKIDNGVIKPNDDSLVVELRGLSTDTKPTTINDKDIGNGSLFIEIDSGKIYFFDLNSKAWKEF